MKLDFHWSESHPVDSLSGPLETLWIPTMTSNRQARTMLLESTYTFLLLRLIQISPISWHNYIYLKLFLSLQSRHKINRFCEDSIFKLAQCKFNVRMQVIKEMNFSKIAIKGFQKV